MFKKTVLLSSLILFSMPNISFSNGDECEECMIQAGGCACAFFTVLCIYAADHNQKIQDFNRYKPVSAPKPQQEDLNKHTPVSAPMPQSMDDSGSCSGPKDKKNK
jgi:hypothetical protein